MPDAELFKIAAEQKLRDPALLEAQPRRILRDPKARAFAESFAGQWLRVHELQTSAQSDAHKFPESAAVRNAMAAEPAEFFPALLRENVTRRSCGVVRSGLNEERSARRESNRRTRRAHRPLQRPRARERAARQSYGARPPHARHHGARVLERLDAHLDVHVRQRRERRNFSFLEGVSGAHHEISHHQNGAEKLEAYKRINQWHLAQYLYMSEKMQGTREGEGTLLDNSMLLFGAGMHDGNAHNPHNLPIVVAGREKGTTRMTEPLPFESLVPFAVSPNT